MKKTTGDKFTRDLNDANRSAELNRARSVTVGTAFGGIVELNMRSIDGNVIWCLLQPVEAIEFIHQLAASVGCHIHIQPRKDFSSWRKWSDLGIGHASHFDDPADHQDKGVTLPSPEQQPGLKIERNDHEPVATKKTVNRRSTKRAAAST